MRCISDPTVERKILADWPAERSGINTEITGGRERGEGEKEVRERGKEGGREGGRERERERERER